MTMTQRVRDMFVKKFEENGFNCEGVKVSSFIDVGIECLVPLTWYFPKLVNGVHDSLKLDHIYFEVIDELGVDDKYSADFDWIQFTDDKDLCDLDKMEEF